MRSASRPREGASVVAEGLYKVYGPEKRKFTAVKDLSFSLYPGDAVAFLGPNGAGKSTTIKILCGILTPTSGVAKISGYAAGSPQANRLQGLVFGTRSQLFMHMTVKQCLDLIGEIYYLTGSDKRARILKIAELFEFTNLLESRVRTLSLGQRMRCEVAAALLHKPRILLADEPTIGLDASSKNKLRELISRWLKEEQSTLLLTSHDLSDVEALCERCILIDKGAKCYDGNLRDVKGDLAGIRRVQITTSGPGTAPFDRDPRIRRRDCEDFIHRYELSTLNFQMSEALALLSAHYGDKLQDIQISEVSLEEVLAKRYRSQA
jgi:ABC-2 type transport system ATP-binding protein